MRCHEDEYRKVGLSSIIHLDFVVRTIKRGSSWRNRKKIGSRQVTDLRITFDMALSNKRKYPVAEFKAFVQSARRSIEITAGDPMIHKSVARAVNGLREFLEVERKRIPGDILFEADRLRVPALRWLRSELRWR